MGKKKLHVFENGIEKKECCFCLRILPLESFRNCSGRWDKKDGHCVDCIRKKENQKYHEDPTKKKESNERWKDKNPDSYFISYKTYNNKNASICAKKRREDRKNNPEKYREINTRCLNKEGARERYYNNKKRKRRQNAIEVREKDRNKYNENKDKIREYNKKWRLENPEKQKAKNKKQSVINRIRKTRDPLFYLRTIIRNCIVVAIRKQGYSKKSHTYELIGCSFSDFVAYLGPKPEGSVHLDHICPCAQAQNEEELIKLQHYMNLRWLSAEENLKKSDNKTPESEDMCRRILNREWIDKRRKK